MSQATQGTPCWYELGTSDLAAAMRFYPQVLGWSVSDAGMPGFDYRLAQTKAGTMVAGMMALDGQEGSPPPNWLIYFVADSVDAACDRITSMRGKVVKPPADIPGTGRFAIVADPQGAVFGLLQPLPMEGAESPGGAFDQAKEGHGSWHELMTGDPKAAFDFYSTLFGWTRGNVVDMGQAGPYQLFAHGGRDIGGMMGLGGSPVPCWLPYFGVDGASAAIDRIKAAGGTVIHGPMEVPGPAYIAVAHDPQGAYFAVVGAAR